MKCTNKDVRSLAQKDIDDYNYSTKYTNSVVEFPTGVVKCAHNVQKVYKKM